MSGDAVVHHFRRLYRGTLILNVGINAQHGARLIAEGAGDLVAFGRDYIANPDLAERIRRDAPLNELRPEYFYGSSARGYTDYPPLSKVTRFGRETMSNDARSRLGKSRWAIRCDFLQVIRSSSRNS